MMTSEIFRVDRRRPPTVDVGIVILVACLLVVFIYLHVFYSTHCKSGHSSKVCASERY